MSEYTGTERRKSLRVPDGIKVRIFNKRIRKHVPIIDISRHGARLRVKSLFRPKEIINFAMYLPNEDSIIDLTARVVRVANVCPIWGFRRFDVGIEFLNTMGIKKERLFETVDYLIRKYRMQQA